MQPIYNPFVSGKGYSSFQNGVLTLEFDTNAAGHANGDVLQIFYDNSDAALQAIVDLSVEIKNLLNIIANPPFHDGSGGLRVNTITTLGTVNAVSTLNSLANIAGIGGNTAILGLTDRQLNVEFALLFRERVTIS
jgi:hypothetical protein